MYNPKFMSMAIRIAERSRGICSPNPFVGAVIVKDDKVISTGSTRVYGSDHAEVVAIKKAGTQTQDASMYVTLEPCSHYGRTAPCANAIVKAGIAEVYIGIEDPNPLVQGKGIQILIDNGVKVQSGLFVEKITKQLEYYLCRITKKRPFVIWKAALSLDGKYAATDGSARWISTPEARTHAHKLRQEVDVILTGANTVILDDPLLNVRLPNPKRHPVRVVLDPFLSISPTAKIVQSARQYKSIFFCTEAMLGSTQEQKLKDLGLSVYSVPSQGEELDLPSVLAILHEMGFYSVLLEAGSCLSESFFEAGLVDKCMIYYGNMLLGGDKSMLGQLPICNISQAIQLSKLTYKALGDGFLVTGYVKP